MAITAAQLVAKVSVEGDAEAKAKLQGVGQEAQKTGEKAKEAGGGLGGMFKNALSFASGQAVFAGLGFLKEQIGGIFTESMNAQAGLAQTNKVIESTHGIAGVTANAVLDLATQYSHLTKFSDDTVQASENMLLTFTNIGKNVFPQATKTVLDMSQALGQDTKSSAIQLGKALNDPITGVSALQRVGVTFNQTQKDTIKHLMDTNNVAGAQGVILKELQKEFGGSAEAAGKTFGGQLAIAQQRLDDIKQSIGDALMPILTSLLQKIGPIVDAFSQWVASGHAVSDVIATFNAHANILIPILTGIGAVLLGGLIAAVWSLAAGVIAATWPFLAIGAAIAGVTAIFMHFYQTNAGFKAFIDNLIVGLKQAWSVIQANFIPGLQIIWSVIQTKVLPVLQQMGNWFVTEGSPILQKFGQFIMEKIVPVIKFLAEVIVIDLTFIRDHWSQIWGMLGPILKGAWDVISGIVKVAWALVSGIIKIGLDFLRGDWKAVWEDMKKMLGGVFDGIGTMVHGFKGMLGGEFSALGTIIHDFFGGLAHRAIQWGANIISNLASGIIGNIGNAIGGAMNAVGSFIHDHLPSSPAKIGPLRDLATQGSKISEQIGQGMVSGMPKLQSSLNLVLTPLSMAPRSSGGPITVVVNVPPQDTYLDGVRLSRGLMPHIAAAIRYNTGGFGR